MLPVAKQSRGQNWFYDSSAVSSTSALPLFPRPEAESGAETAESEAEQRQKRRKAGVKQGEAEVYRHPIPPPYTPTLVHSLRTPSQVHLMLTPGLVIGAAVSTVR